MTANRTGRDGSGARGGASRSSPELARLRTEIDELDRRIVALINERNELVRAVGHEKLAIGRRYVRDREREARGPAPRLHRERGSDAPADLLSIFRRLIASARALETAERDRLRRDEKARPSHRARDATQRSCCLLPRDAVARRPGSHRRRPAALHLGHLANAIYVWGLARRFGARVSSASRTTTASAAAPSTRRRSSTTSTGWGSPRTSHRRTRSAPGRRATARAMAPRSTPRPPSGWGASRRCTRASAHARRSRRGARRTGASGPAPAPP